MKLRLVDATELLHELLGARNDGVATGLEELAGIEALALFVLASLDVATHASSEDELEVGVDVNLGDTEGDGLLDLILGDAGAAMKNEREIAGLGLDLTKTLEGKASQVGGVHAMDVADAAGQEVNAQVSDLLALSRISELTVGGHAVLGAADAANLSLDGKALGMSELDEFLGAVEVELEGLLMGTVIHDRGEAGLDALEAVLIRTVIEVKSDGNGNTRSLNSGLDHVCADLEAAHPLSSASGALKNQRRLGLLGSLKNGKRPLQVVGVESAESVVTGLCLLQHICCVDEHT